MSNAEYVFNETNRDRAITARGAWHKKSGAKSKSCNLSTDKMSASKIQKMHGPVESWNLSRFMTWEEFKLMPDDLQVEYLNKLIGKYHVGYNSIAKHLFNLSDGALYQHLKNRNYLDKVTRIGRGYPKAQANYIDVFCTDILKQWEEGSVKEETEEIVGKQEAAVEQNNEILTDEKLIEAINAKRVMKLQAVLETNDAVESAPDPMAYHDVTFASSYIRMGLDTEEFYKLANLFDGKRVKVNIDITVL